MGRPIHVSLDDLENILAETFSGRSKRPVNIDMEQLAEDLTCAIAAFRVAPIILNEDLNTKAARRVLDQLVSSLRHVDNAFRVARRDGYMSLISGKLAQLDENGTPTDARGFDGWLVEAEEYRLKLEAMVQNIQERPQPAGRRHSSPFRLWVGYSLVSVYREHLGSNTSLAGPWGRFVNAVAKHAGIAVSENSAHSTMRSVKNVIGR